MPHSVLPITKAIRRHTSKAIMHPNLLFDVYAQIYTTVSISASFSDGFICLSTNSITAMSNSTSPILQESIPSSNSLKALAETLVQWRGLLPKELQWAEDDPAAYPAPHAPPNINFKSALDPTLSQAPLRSQPPLFSTDLDQEPAQYRYLYDIQVALLRSRYYYAKYIVYRPFIYKALHFPEQVSQTDAEGVAECLRVSEFLLDRPSAY